MNDTEAEARRLLAAATQDMPPGIDLLAGFAAARRRDRTRRTRRRAFLSAGAAAAAGGVTAAALTIGSVSPALATVTSALTSTLTQSYHLTEASSSYYVQNSGQITNRAHITCISEANPARHLAMSSCPGGATEREVGRYSYIYVGHPAGHPGKHWMRIPGSLDQLPAPSINGFTTATPQQILPEIKKASTVTAVGPVSGHGWTGTRYSFTARPAAAIRLSGTVDVDRQGRARALALTMRIRSRVNVLVITQALTFSDFGAPVTVTPPPADQTFPGP